MKKLVRSAAFLISFACCATLHARGAVFYDGVFTRGKGAVGCWEFPKLRDWIWEHWRTHVPATATLHAASMEGEGFDTDVTIAKASSGVLYLCIHTTGWQRAMRPDGGTPTWRDDWLIAYSVTRTSEPYHDDWPGNPILHSRHLPPREYVLELKDKEGKIVTHL